jgi:hypothetical protein
MFRCRKPYSFILQTDEMATAAYIDGGPGCYHRPGKKIGKTARACKYCGVGIEECPCLDWGRTTQPNCPCCLSSGWVAVVRGRIAKCLEVWETMK